ncbi:hypothetical protein ML462_04020 [Gramella lutea]|uniref:Polymer-forming cytoskeletal protein n=1 Tax=Christiangramia lutea TaxID=1607951 RepID=A0A9X1V1J0_9FLAO|nr:hypothetical protein [Christiangramia lutea]MCH4822331.1 hypothetical protein [Christiangramia lutea]
MKTQFLSLSLIAALAFTSCQSDVNSESPEEINEVQKSLKEVKHDFNKIHEMPLTGVEGNGGFRLHEPGYFQGALADCDTYQHYEGGSELMVIQNQPQSYHGEVEVNNIKLNEQLNICGTVMVHNDVKVNYAGVFNVGGEMITEGNVHVIYGGHLVVEGKLIIEGDLTLGNGATLEFLGDESSIEVLGNAKIHKKANIGGKFKDVSQKIK